jgi:hypothetical protein
MVKGEGKPSEIGSPRNSILIKINKEISTDSNAEKKRRIQGPSWTKSPGRKVRNDKRPKDPFALDSSKLMRRRSPQ